MSDLKASFCDIDQCHMNIVNDYKDRLATLLDEVAHQIETCKSIDPSFAAELRLRQIDIKRNITKAERLMHLLTFEYGVIARDAK